LGRIDPVVRVRDLALFVTGVRRVGKTTLTKQYLEKLISAGNKRESTLYVNLDEPSFQPMMSTGLLDDIYSSYRHYIHPEGRSFIVLDEVQNVDGWERWVRSMMDRSENCFFIVTGSSSSIMTREIGTLLTGRYIEQRVGPLSLKEYLTFTGQDKVGFVTEEMKESRVLSYLENGGFPSIVLNQDPSLKREQLNELYQAIINRDLVSRFGLRNSSDVRSFVPLVAQSVSQKVSASKVHRTLKNLNRGLSPSTVNHYLSLLEESLLFSFIPIRSHNVKNRLLFPKKAYCVDTGMALVSQISSKPIWGRLAENAVANRLLSIYSKEDIGYWKDDRGNEVDFVIGRGGKDEAMVQVSWDVTEKATLDREVGSLRKGMEEMGPDMALLVIGRGKVPDLDDISCISLYDLLLIEDEVLRKGGLMGTK